MIELNLYGNHQKIIRRFTLAGLPKLRYLYLGNSEIETIEDGALDFPNLEYLNLGENKLKILSDVVFDRLQNPKTIELNKNELEHIGRSLYALPAVENMFMYENRIHDIDLAAFASIDVARKWFHVCNNQNRRGPGMEFKSNSLGSR